MVARGSAQSRRYRDEEDASATLQENLRCGSGRTAAKVLSLSLRVRLRLRHSSRRAAAKNRSSSVRAESYTMTNDRSWESLGIGDQLFFRNHAIRGS